MPKKTNPYDDLEKQIDAQTDLLAEIAADPDPTNRLDRLETCRRALLNILRSLKMLHELAGAAEDPTALLRKALAELEAEWPELHGCKEMLRNGGAITPAEASNVSA